MFKFTLFLCFICFCALTPYVIVAMTPEQKAEIHAHFEAMATSCVADNMITEDDINNLRTRKIPTGPNAPCFLACLMKNMGTMDDRGILQKETALELAKSVFKDEEEIKIIEDYLHSCSSVNSEPVIDGEKGCDRAMLAYKCMVENAPKFGFDV